MTKQMRGVYAILPTPYKDNLEIDYDDLRHCVDFCIATQTHGIVMPVNASEFHLLDDEERKKVMEVTAKQANGRIPVIGGITGKTVQEAVEFARCAEAVGCDAVMAMPPYVMHVGESEVYDFYAQINKAVSIPIFIQNFVPPIGTPISVELLLKMVRDFEHVQYIKEETTRSPQVITRLLEGAKALPSDSLLGVMGGMSGRQIIEEFDRGACGSMPACLVADVLADLWNALEAGSREKADELFKALMPIISYDGVYPIIAYKEVLVRRGAIKNAKTRANTWGKLDAQNSKEIDKILSDLKPYFRV